MNRPVDNHASQASVQTPSDRAQVLLEINNAIVSHLDMPHLLRAIPACLRRLIPHDFAAMSLYYPESNQLQAHGLAFPPNQQHLEAGQLIPLEGTPPGLAFTGGQPVLRRRLDINEFPHEAVQQLLAAGITSDCVVRDSPWRGAGPVMDERADFIRDGRAPAAAGHETLQEYDGVSRQNRMRIMQTNPLQNQPKIANVKGGSIAGNAICRSTSRRQFVRRHAAGMLRWRTLSKLLLMCAAALGVLSAPILAAQESSSTARLLSLEEAIHLAIANNRSLQIASLDVDKSRWQVAEFKTKRLPSLSGTVLGSELLNELSFTFKEGAFGNFPSTGPIPNQDTKITTPRQPTAYVVGQVTQPLSQLYKIHLGLRAQELSSQLTSEKLRSERQSVIRDVKQAYYAVLQSESALEAAEANVKQYNELDRVVLQRVSQEAALKSDSLEVKAKLANEQYTLVQLRHTLDSRKEYLNDLLGRDIRTEFRTEPVPPASFEEVELKLAQDRALTRRPEVKQAELNVQRAVYDRRMAKADYIPEVGIAFNYLSPFNVDILPTNIASVGVQVKWEPWDWGRRKDVVNQKKITENQAQAQLRDTQSKVLMDVNSRFRKLEESRLLIAVAQASREASQQKLREVDSQYEQEAVLLKDVLQQQAAAASAADDYRQALLGFWAAKSDFEKSLGDD